MNTTCNVDIKGADNKKTSILFVDFDGTLTQPGYDKPQDRRKIHWMGQCAKFTKVKIVIITLGFPMPPRVEFVKKSLREWFADPSVSFEVNFVFRPFGMMTIPKFDDSYMQLVDKREQLKRDGHDYKLSADEETKLREYDLLDVAFIEYKLILDKYACTLQNSQAPKLTDDESLKLKWYENLKAQEICRYIRDIKDYEIMFIDDYVEALNALNIANTVKVRAYENATHLNVVIAWFYRYLLPSIEYESTISLLKNILFVIDDFVSDCSEQRIIDKREVEALLYINSNFNDNVPEQCKCSFQLFALLITCGDLARKYCANFIFIQEEELVPRIYRLLFWSAISMSSYFYAKINTYEIIDYLDLLYEILHSLANLVDDNYLLATKSLKKSYSQFFAKSFNLNMICNSTLTRVKSLPNFSNLSYQSMHAQIGNILVSDLNKVLINILVLLKRIYAVEVCFTNRDDIVMGVSFVENYFVTDNIEKQLMGFYFFVSSIKGIVEREQIASSSMYELTLRSLLLPFAQLENWQITKFIELNNNLAILYGEILQKNNIEIKATVTLMR
jgi:hypothetical protein